MADVVHRIGIQARPAEVFAAAASLEGLGGWWTRQVEGSTAAGGEITFTFSKPDGGVIDQMVMKVARLVDGERVEWQCLAGPDEWLTTTIEFVLAEEDGMTILTFAQRGWAEAGAFYSHCSMKWATFLLSLRSFVETGRGAPSPDDLKIDNWN